MPPVKSWWEGKKLKNWGVEIFFLVANFLETMAQNATILQTTAPVFF